MARLEKSSFNRPSFFEPIPDIIGVNTEMFTKRRQARSEPSHCQNAIGPGVSGLLFVSGPLAVFLEVAQRVILSIKRHAGRSFSHIFKEVLEDSPSLTDLDAASAIKVKPNVLWIRASANHGPPSYQRRTGAPVNRMSVSQLHGVCVLPTKTTARLGISAFQVRIRKRNRCAAFAEAYAGSVPVFVLGGICNDFQSSKYLTDEGYSSGHRIGSFNFVSSGGSGYNRPRCGNIGQTRIEINP